MKKVSEKYLIIFEYALNSICKQNVNKNDSKCTLYLFCYKMSAILYRGHDNSSKINNDLKQRGKK